MNNDKERILKCREQVDKLVLDMWMALNEMSELHVQNIDEMSFDDIDLWAAITKHSSIQNRLKAIPDGDGSTV